MEEIKKETSSTEDAQEILNKFNEDKELAKAEALIIDNKIEFEYEERTYRVRLLNLPEKEELYMLKLSKFGQLLKNKDILMEKDLIKTYAERGINIAELTDQIKKLEAEIFDMQFSLGEAISKSEAKTILKTYEDRINILKQSKQLLIIQKSSYLSNSLESQLENYEAQFITYLTLEIFDGEKWNKAFKTFEEFKKCEEEELINRAGTRSMFLQYF